jgi:hypothetical protein
MDLICAWIILVLLATMVGVALAVEVEVAAGGCYHLAPLGQGGGIVRPVALVPGVAVLADIPEVAEVAALVEVEVAAIVF